MAPSPSRQLEQILNKTRQPLLSELDSKLMCHICHDPFLSGNEPEISIKLPCGHTYVPSCILKWLSPLSKEDGNSCPMCRKAIIDDWDRGFEDEIPERVGGTRPRIRVTDPVPTQQARLRAAFAQAYEQAYEQVYEQAEELFRKKQLLISKQWTSPWSVNASNELEMSRIVGSGSTSVKVWCELSRVLGISTPQNGYL